MIPTIFQDILTFSMWFVLVSSGVALIATLFLDWSKFNEKQKGGVSGLAMLFCVAAVSLIVI